MTYEIAVYAVGGKDRTSENLYNSRKGVMHMDGIIGSM